MEDDRFNVFCFKYYSSFHFGKCNIINFVIRSHEQKEIFFPVTPMENLMT